MLDILEHMLTDVDGDFGGLEVVFEGREVVGPGILEYSAEAVGVQDL